MNSEPHGTSSRTQGALDPDRLLLELGWADSPTADRAPTRARPAKHYCSFCWTAIPDGDIECASCGRSLAEIQAVAAKSTRADPAAWKPQRLGGAAAVARPRISPHGVVTLTTPAASHVAVRHGIPTALRFLGTSTLVVALLAGSAMGGAWLGTLTLKHDPVVPLGTPQQAVVPSLSGSPRIVEIQWDNPHPELRLELVGPAGTILADSTGGTTTQLTLAPGDYRLRTRDADGVWQPVERGLTIGANGTLVLAPSPEAVASYYTDRGRRLRDAKRLQEAEQAWRTAIQVRPAHADALLQLAELLIQDARQEEARGYLRTANEASPDDPRALRLMRQLRAAGR